MFLRCNTYENVQRIFDTNLLKYGLFWFWHCSSIYEAAGYTKEQTIKGVKAIDNWFSNKKGVERDWD